MSVKCSVVGCQNDKSKVGLCGMHYARLRRHGDVGPAYSLNVNGDYCLENCRWADWGTQQRNRSNTIKILYAGKEYTLSELSQKKKISVSTLYNRIMKYNWSIEKSLSTPIRRGRPNREI